MKPGRTNLKIAHFFICIFSISVIFAVSVCVYFDDIFTYSVSRFTGYDISFVGWKKSILNKNEILGLQLTSREHNLVVTIDKAEISFDIKKYLKERDVSVVLFFEGVSLGYCDGKSKPVFPADSLYGLFVGPDQKFKSVRSSLLWEDKVFSISDLNADSQNIKVFGDCSFSENGDDADIDITLSVSPVLASVLDPGVRNRVLCKEDTGWYTTVINYKGNTVLLRAIYQLGNN